MPVTSHQLKAYYHFGKNKFISLGSNMGRELLVNDTKSPVYQDVYGVQLSGKHAINNYFGLTYLLKFHQQGDSYAKQGVRIGFYVSH